MSENVKVPYGKGGDNATLLLAAAEELDMEANVVRTTMYGFEVPKEVADKAGVDTYDPDAEFEAEVKKARKEADSAREGDEEVRGQDMTLSRSGFDEQASNVEQSTDAGEKKSTAKKATAKKATAKKSTAKKATAKKTTAKKTVSKES